MRSFSKKLAFVLAAAMVVTAFAPAAKAEAAKEMAINKSSQILYVNEGINHKGGEVAAPGKGNVSVYDFSVKNKPADWKTALKFEWSTNEPDVVSVEKGGVVTALSVGKATVYCKVTEKATGEVTTLKTKVTVKANAYDVEITNADKWDGATVEVNGVVDLNRAMYDEDGNKTTKRGTLVTDYTKWVAEPAAGVEIEQSTGKFTFTEDAVAGEYKLSCYTYQSSKYTEKTAESDVVVVEFVNGIEFKQTTLKKFDILLGSAADIKAEDVAIDEVVVGPTGEYRVSTMIKGVTMSADKKTATVEVFYDLKDGVSYEVSVKGYDKQTLVASAGKPVAMTVYAKDVYGGQVSIGKMTELAYTLIDANGVDVTAGTDAEKNKVVFNLKYVGKSGANYEMSYYAGYATFDFTEVGDYAVISGEYATGDFENNVEVKITAPSITVYGVEKQLVTVQSVVDYTTQTAGWNNFWSANKDVVKMSQTNNLAVKVSLLDGKEVVITTQGQTVSDYEGVTHGYVTVETTNASKDFIDIDAVEGGAMTLRPRKVGVAQLMVYYNVILPDGSVQKSAVAPITIKIKDAPALNAIGFNYAGTAPATVIVSINPEEDHNDLRYVWNNFQLLDQYGDTYPNEKIESVVLVGNNQAAQDLVTNEGIKIMDSSNYQVATPKFQIKIHEMNATAINPDKISGKFYFTIKAKATNGVEKTNTIVVDVRGLSDNEVIGTDFAKDNYVDSTTGGNIARMNASNPWNAAAEKFVKFAVFDKQNGANVDHREIAPYYTITDINAASDGYYYKVFKDNSDITKTATEAGLIIFDNDNAVKVRFSGVKIDGNGKQIVSYDNVGAGTYQFVLYKVEPSRYNAAVKVASQVSSAAKTVTVTCDPGKYTLTGRDAVIIYNADGKVPATVSSLDLLKCFNFADKGNNAFSKNPWDNNTDTQANFGGNMIDYVVTLNNELQRPNSVYVDYVTFYEAIPGADGLYAAYKVDVKCFVEYRAAQ